MGRFEKIKAYYRQNDKPDHPDYYLLGWESVDAQQLRFKALINSLDLNGKSILDIGCGTGNLLQFLNERFKNFSYTGIDILEHMINNAKKKNLNGIFLCMDIFKANPFSQGEFDAVFASGTFNINLGNNEEFLISALRIFDHISNKTIAFNLLSENSQNKEEGYFYSSPDKICKLIDENFADHFVLRVIEGYLQNDFTIICKKKNV